MRKAYKETLAPTNNKASITSVIKIKKLNMEAFELQKGIYLYITKIRVDKTSKDIFGHFLYLLDNMTHYEIEVEFDFTNCKNISKTNIINVTINPFSITTDYALHEDKPYNEKSKICQLEYYSKYYIDIKMKFDVKFPSLKKQYELINTDKFEYNVLEILSNTINNDNKLSISTEYKNFFDCFSIEDNVMSVIDKKDNINFEYKESHKPENNNNSNKLIDKNYKEYEFNDIDSLIQNSNLNYFIDLDFKPNVTEEIIPYENTLPFYNKLQDIPEEFVKYYTKVAVHWRHLNNIQRENINNISLGYITQMSLHHGIKNNTNYISVISHLVERNFLVYRLIRTKVLNKTGVFVVDLFVNGSWRHVLLDGYLPCVVKSYCIYSFNNNGSYWISLIEKAIAKTLGSYDSIRDLTFSELYRMLTGYSILSVSLDINNIQNTIDLLDYYINKKNYLISAYNNPNVSLKLIIDEDVNLLKNTLFHCLYCYPLIAYYTIDKHKLFVIRNLFRSELLSDNDISFNNKISIDSTNIRESTVINSNRSKTYNLLDKVQRKSYNVRASTINHFNHSVLINRVDLSSIDNNNLNLEYYQLYGTISKDTSKAELASTIKKYNDISNILLTEKELFSYFNQFIIIPTDIKYEINLRSKFIRVIDFINDEVESIISSHYYEFNIDNTQIININLCIKENDYFSSRYDTYDFDLSFSILRKHSDSTYEVIYFHPFNYNTIIAEIELKPGKYILIPRTTGRSMKKNKEADQHIFEPYSLKDDILLANNNNSFNFSDYRLNEDVLINIFTDIFEMNDIYCKNYLNYYQFISILERFGNENLIIKESEFFDIINNKCKGSKGITYKVYINHIMDIFKNNLYNSSNINNSECSINNIYNTNNNASSINFLMICNNNIREILNNFGYDKNLFPFLNKFYMLNISSVYPIKVVAYLNYITNFDYLANNLLLSSIALDDRKRNEYTQISIKQGIIYVEGVRNNSNKYIKRITLDYSASTNMHISTNSSIIKKEISPGETLFYMYLTPLSEKNYLRNCKVVIENYNNNNNNI